MNIANTLSGGTFRSSDKSVKKTVQIWIVVVELGQVRKVSEGVDGV